MKVRAIKQRFSRVMGGRLMAPWRWRSAEDIEWGPLVPVGREFGSPDFDRLMEMDDAAFSSFGSIKRGRQWHNAPNDQLGGLPPEDVARSSDGWAKVMSLLKKVD